MKQKTQFLPLKINLTYLLRMEEMEILVIVGIILMVIGEICLPHL